MPAKVPAETRVGHIHLKVTDLDRAIHLNPESSISFEFRARAYRELGRFREAEEDDARARELDPFFEDFS